MIEMHHLTKCVAIGLCVNNEHGYDTGKLWAVDFGNELLRLESKWGLSDPGCTCSYDAGKKRIRLGRRVFPVRGYTSYVGNVMWDSIWVDIPTANAIAEHLRKQGVWCIEAGSEALWDNWNNGAPIDFGAEGVLK